MPGLFYNKSLESDKSKTSKSIFIEKTRVKILKKRRLLPNRTVNRKSFFLVYCKEN